MNREDRFTYLFTTDIVYNMSPSLRDEIRQRTFDSLEHEAALNLMRTADQFGRQVTELLDAAELTGTQFNVLRILRGAGPAGLAAGEIGERLVTRGPDVTRLIDRLERQGRVCRDRCSEDRRVVTVKITPEGLRTLAELDEPMRALHVRQLGHLDEARLRLLIDLLEEARLGAKAEPPGPTAG